MHIDNMILLFITTLIFLKRTNEKKYTSTSGFAQWLELQTSEQRVVDQSQIKPKPVKVKVKYCILN